MQRKFTLLLFVLIIILVICILLRSRHMMQKLDQQMPEIGCTLTSFETRL